MLTTSTPMDVVLTDTKTNELRMIVKLTEPIVHGGGVYKRVHVT